MTTPHDLDCAMCGEQLFGAPACHAACRASFCSTCISERVASSPAGGVLCPACGDPLPSLSELRASASPELLASLAAETRFEDGDSGPRPLQPLQWRSAADAAYAAEALPQLKAHLSLEAFASTFPLARSLRREVELFVGPPNSGKTHAALAALAASQSGAYLAPLRLLAAEARDALWELGVASDLVTGEDEEKVEGARHMCCTIEMLDASRSVELIVIDEGQMLFDASRGWAWTHAVLGAPCRRLVIVCAEHAIAALQRLLAPCGEEVRITRFARKSELAVLETPVSLQELKPGDAVIAFSRAEALAMRDKIVADRCRGNGSLVAVVYGALSNKVRGVEAERFCLGEAQYLVATDAIGQGLNLAIRRVLFSALVRFNGHNIEDLPPADVQQIAGRAGRYRLVERGFVGVLDTCGGGVEKLVRLLNTRATAPPHFRAPIAARGPVVRAIARTLRMRSLVDVLEAFASLAVDTSGIFAAAGAVRTLEIAAVVDACAPRLRIGDRFAYACAPLPSRDKPLLAEFARWVSAHADAGVVGDPSFARLLDAHGVVRSGTTLAELERGVTEATLYLFCATKYPEVYAGAEEALATKELLQASISVLLAGDAGLGSAWEARRQGAPPWGVPIVKSVSDAQRGGGGGGRPLPQHWHPACEGLGRRCTRVSEDHHAAKRYIHAPYTLPTGGPWITACSSSTSTRCSSRTSTSCTTAGPPLAAAAAAARRAATPAAAPVPINIDSMRVEL